MKTFLYSFVLLLAFIVTAPLRAAEPQIVTLYTYHTHPPFITGTGEGLTFDLAAFLTDRSNGKFIFNVVLSSRPRINRLIESDRWGIVPWVNPKWFKDPDKSVYLWSERALMEDANAIISHKRKPINYKSAEALDGMTFGGIKGHKYTGIDDFISQGGNLRRLDAANHLDNLNKLLRGDIDVMLMPHSGALFSIAKHDFTQETYFSPTPHSRYDRRFLVINHRRNLRRLLDDILGNFGDEWSTIVARYE